MLNAKSRGWWINNPQRARANNSTVLLRSETKYETFSDIFNVLTREKGGEPGFFFTENIEERGYLNKNFRLPGVFRKIKLD